MGDAAFKVTLFEDIFEVTGLNPEGKKFDKVNRLTATGTTFGCSLLLDTNSEIYPIIEGESLTLVLASSLHLDGSPDDGSFNQTNEPSMADNYEYVMYGRVFEYQHKGDGKIAIQISFGGLLMRIVGEHKHLSGIQPDARLYILIKKSRD